MHVHASIQTLQSVIDRLENLIVKQGQNLHACLWGSLKSNLDALFITVPKFINYRPPRASTVSLSEQLDSDIVLGTHITTIINASSLVSSITSEILSKLRFDEVISQQIKRDNNRFLSMVDKVKVLIRKPSPYKDKYMVVVLDQLHKLLESLLFLYQISDSYQQQQQQKQHDGFNEVTVTTEHPVSSLAIDSCISYSSLQTIEMLDQQQIAQKIGQSEQYDLPIYRQEVLHTRNSHEKSNSNSTERLGKLFIRGFAALNKVLNTEPTTSPETSIWSKKGCFQSRSKIDEERQFVIDSVNHSITPIKSKSSASRTRFNSNGSKKQQRESIEGFRGSSYDSKVELTDTKLSQILSPLQIEQYHKLGSKSTGSLSTLAKPHANRVHIKALWKSSDEHQQHHKTEAVFCSKVEIEDCTDAMPPLFSILPQKRPCFVHRSISENNCTISKSNAVKLLDKFKLKQKKQNRPSTERKGDKGAVEEEKAVAAASLDDLFLKLTDTERMQHKNMNYIDTFLVTHSFFTDSVRLLDYLIARFYCNPAPFNRWTIQLRIFNILLRWIKLHFEPFALDPTLLRKLDAFLDEWLDEKSYKSEVEAIREAIKIQIVQHEKPCLDSQYSIPCLITSSPLQKMASSAAGFTPPTSPKSSYDGLTVPLLSQHSQDIAMYLTLIEFANLRCITAYDYIDTYIRRSTGTTQEKEIMQPKHCTKSAFNNLLVGTGIKSEKKVNYISLMVERTNALSRWVIDVVMEYEIGSKARAEMVCKMIEIAEFCLDWNNFHTSMAITLGLTRLPDLQGKPEWPWRSSIDNLVHKQPPPLLTLPPQSVLAYRRLLKYIDVSENMGFYRNALKKARPSPIDISNHQGRPTRPCIPFFPILLKDLHFLLDGNETKRLKDGLINFSKFCLLKKMLDGISSFTAEPYCFNAKFDHYPFYEDMFCRDVSGALLNKISLPNKSFIL